MLVIKVIFSFLLLQNFAYGQRINSIDGISQNNQEINRYQHFRLATSGNHGDYMLKVDCKHPFSSNIFNKRGSGSPMTLDGTLNKKDLKSSNCQKFVLTAGLFRTNGSWIGGAAVKVYNFTISATSGNSNNNSDGELQCPEKEHENYWKPRYFYLQANGNTPANQAAFNEQWERDNCSGGELQCPEKEHENYWKPRYFYLQANGNTPANQATFDEQWERDNCSGGDDSSGNNSGSTTGRLLANTPARVQDIAIGTNLDGFSRLSGTYPFVDLFKLSESRACHYDESTKGPLKNRLGFDAQGWVTDFRNEDCVRYLVIVHPPEGENVIPKGEFTITWQGSGNLQISGATIVSQGPNRIIVKDVKDPFSIVLQKNNFVKNIRVLLPGGSCSENLKRSCESNSDCSGNCLKHKDNYTNRIWNPDYLRDLHGRGVVRFMNWQGINASDYDSFDDFAKVNDAQYKTIPPQLIGSLAKALNTSAWINVPHKCDKNACLYPLADAIISSISNGTRIFLEYSNETWNTGQPFDVQHYYAQREGRDRGLPILTNNQHEYASAYTAYMSKKIWDIFESRLNNRGDAWRLVKVLPSQSANLWIAKVMNLQPQVFREADAIAIGPYMKVNFNACHTQDGNNINTNGNCNHDRQAKVAMDNRIYNASKTFKQTGNLNPIFDIVEEARVKTAGDMQIYKQFINQYYPHLKLIAYEGGQHMFFSWRAC